MPNTLELLAPTLTSGCAPTVGDKILKPKPHKKIHRRRGTTYYYSALLSHGRGMPASGGTCVCRRRRVAIAAGRARIVPLARHPRPSQPRPAEGLRRAAHACAATGTSRSKRARHAPYRSRDAITLPSHGRWRASAVQFMCAASGASRSQQDEHAPCRSRDASALPSRHWRPGRDRGSRLRYDRGLRL